MRRGYDNVAWFYDGLARIVYGKTLLRAQQYLIAAVPAGANILIVGGGSGWILEELTAMHAAGLNITYVDAAAKMIALARKRKTGANDVVFIHDVMQHVPVTQKYDVAITPFLFDNFSEETAAIVFDSIDKSLKEDGLWLFADFQLTDDKVFWQGAMLATMYFLFRIMCGVEANKLPDTNRQFTEHHYQLTVEKTFLKKFIVSRIFRKTINR
jgi:ubiquinone/menaquinone biosynthesis C-methylase UbiE